jgi:hypothetical protein
MLGITLDLAELGHLAERVDEEMDRIAKKVTAELLTSSPSPFGNRMRKKTEQSGNGDLTRATLTDECRYATIEPDVSFSSTL